MPCTTATIACEGLWLHAGSKQPQCQSPESSDPGSPDSSEWQRMRVNCAQEDLVQHLTAFKQTFLLVYRDLMIHPHKVADWSV